MTTRPFLLFLVCAALILQACKKSDQIDIKLENTAITDTSKAMAGWWYSEKNNSVIYLDKDSFSKSAWLTPKRYYASSQYEIAESYENNFVGKWFYKDGYLHLSNDTKLSAKNITARTVEISIVGTNYTYVRQDIPDITSPPLEKVVNEWAGQINSQLENFGPLAIDNNDNVYYLKNNDLIKIANDGSTTTIHLTNVDPADATFRALRYVSPGVFYLFTKEGWFSEITITDGTASVKKNDLPGLTGGLGSASIAINKKGDIFFSARSGYIKKIAKDGSLTTIAGNGTAIYSGDGRSALQTGITPGAITLDNEENIIFGDNAWIRKIDLRTQLITTIAGTGNRVLTNAVGNALSTPIDYPTQLCVSSTGDIFYGDSKMIKKISKGMISNVAGHAYESASFWGLTQQSVEHATETALSFREIKINSKNELYITSFFYRGSSLYDMIGIYKVKSK